MRNPNDSDGASPRFRDDDEMIGLDEARRLLGGISVSAAYDDPDVMVLKIPMTPPGRQCRRIVFIKREVLALRAERVALAAAMAADVRAGVERRLELRRIRQARADAKRKIKPAAAAVAT